MGRIPTAILFAIVLSNYALAEPAQTMQKPAQESGKKLTAQQMKMKNCNREAKEKKFKGEERRRFMKSCLSGKK